MLNYIFEAEGKSKSEAENNILTTLRLQADDVRFETVEAGKSGFFGLTAKKPAVVRAYINENKQVPAEKIIHGVTLTLLKKMGVNGNVVGMGDVDGKIYVELESDESGLLIGKRGATLDAIQFLLNIMVDSNLRQGKKVILDIESYRDKRELSLIKLSKSIASHVNKSNRSKLLEPMNPYERRIIHMTLQKDGRVFTRSEGNGTYKRVRIIPMKDRGKYKDVDLTEKFDANQGVEDFD
ncbi:MAG: RNA-binding cell elongation regulator Jag/EloR [Spirochaetota bacterium]